MAHQSTQDEDIPNIFNHFLGYTVLKALNPLQPVGDSFCFVFVDFNGRSAKATAVVVMTLVVVLSLFFLLFVCSQPS